MKKKTKRWGEQREGQKNGEMAQWVEVINMRAGGVHMKDQREENKG